MPKTGRNDIWFDSADGKHKVAGYIYAPGTPRLVVQVSHGMCEYIGRYEEFAAYLNEHGIALAGNDHLGHGATAADKDDRGFFTEMGGREYVLKDLHSMNALVHTQYPGVPVVLLGHSMGSFYAREYAARWPDTLAGLVISGTGGPNPAVNMGIFLTRLLAFFRGPRYRSELIHSIAFGAYLKRIENPNTPYDWISRDEEMVEIYNGDELCTFRFTVNGFHELFGALKQVSGPAWAAKLPTTLPILLISGEEDPVGDYGEGVKKVDSWLRETGHSTTCKLYPGMRHEVLNETGREEVYKDVLSFVAPLARQE